MKKYFSSGGLIKLGQEVGRGGQGVVYKVSGHPDRLAKIYYQPTQNGSQQKLNWMKQNPPKDPTISSGHASIAWLIDLIQDQNGAVAGYIMPYIQEAASLFEVFHPQLRARKLSGFNRSHLYRTARNLAVTLAAIHDRDYVVGDLNESNVLVTPLTLVTLIDTDSFQLEQSKNGRIEMFFCTVGKPEYTAPELQRKVFSETPRTPASDNFALSVLIFQLLMDGNHPFRAHWLSDEEPASIEEKIAQGYFPHTEAPPYPVEPPQNMFPIDVLHPRIVNLMEICFVEGHKNPSVRPTPSMWELAIREAEKSLIQCSQGHYYSNHLSKCPYCQKRKMTKVVEQKCPHCNATNSVDEIFCQNCAHQLCADVRCSSCKKLTPAKGCCCIYCGVNL